MLQNTVFSLGLASASRLHAQTKRQHASQDILAALKQSVDDASCFPGIATMFDSEEAAINSWSGTGTYVDDSFIGQDALFYSWQGASEESTYSSDVNAWTRIQDIDSSDFSFFGPYGIRPGGVSQGSLGDCWFLAAGSALAEEGARIKQVFNNKGKQANGFYVLKFFVLGEPKYITVDDRIPVMDAEDYFGYQGAQFSGGHQYLNVNAKKSQAGAWWMPVLEKAYAKFNLNYAALSGGHEFEALRAMTGMPAQTFRDDKITWDLIKDGDENGYVMTGACWVSKYGLVDGHAYSILGVNESTGRVIVRNPWSSESYHGPGSDQENDGKFEVPWDIFKEAFTGVTILYYKDWKVTDLGKQTFTGSRELKYWNIYTEEPQEVIITIDVASSRQTGAACQGAYEKNLVDLEYKTGKDKTWTWQDAEGYATANPTYTMTNNIMFDQMGEGWYTIKIDTDAYGSATDPPMAGTNYNIHVYSAKSHIHIYEGNYQVSSVQDAEYVEPGQIVGDDDAEILDESTEIVNDSGETCTAAGCVSTDSGDNGGVVPSGGECVDSTKKDSYDWGCDLYALNTEYCYWEEAGFIAKDECCACGGGNVDSAAEVCEDDPTAKDSYNWGCLEFAQSPEWCHWEEVGFSAKEKCPVACDAC